MVETTFKGQSCGASPVMVEIAIVVGLAYNRKLSVLVSFRGIPSSSI